MTDNETDRPELVGRSEEFTRLLGALDDAAEGQAGMVLVGGDAGIGKTRLVTELAVRARARRCTVLVGQCAEFGDSVPYFPLADALRTHRDPDTTVLVAEAVRERPVLRRLLPDVGDDADTESEADLTQQRLFGAVLGLLGALSEERPVLLVFEDLHWADRSTRDLLTFLSRVLRGERICLIGTYRSDDLHRRHPLRPLIAELVRLPTATAVDLRPLDRAALTEHLGALSGDHDPGPLDTILALAEGNPFYAEELLAASSDGERLPVGLVDLLLSRVERLSETAQEVLGVAAVAGRRVDDELVSAVSGLPLPAYDAAMREIVSHRLLTPVGEGYTFRHALLREAVYSDLLPGRRTRAHASFAALIADQESRGRPRSAAELAHHYLAAHDMPGAFAASVRAGIEAERVGAPADAHRHFDQALSLWETVPEPERLAGLDRTHLALRSAAAVAHAGESQRAAAHLHRVRGSLGDATAPEARAELNERLAYYLANGDDISAAVEAARAACDLLPADPPTPLLARTLATYARAILPTKRHDEVPSLVDRALAAARATDASDAEAEALVTLGIHTEIAGPAERADELFATAREQARHTGNLSVELRAVFQLARCEYERGDLSRAADTAADGARLAVEAGLGWSHYGTDLRFLQYLVHYTMGDWDRAEELAGDFAVKAGTVAQGTVSAYALFVEVGRGRSSVDERLSWLSPLSARDDFIAYVAHGLAAEHALWHGDTDTAVEHATAAGRAVDAWDPAGIRVAAIALWAWADRADRARAAGRSADEAVAAADELIEQARHAASTSGPLERPRAGLGPEGRGWLGRAEAEWHRARGDDEPAMWRAVLDTFDFGFVYEVARSRWRLAEALIAAGDRNEARTQWNDAVDAADRLGAAPLRRALDELGRRADFDRATPDTRSPTGLTAREREVLRLLAEGMGNRQIAGRLFISPKTVSVHVSNILAKLGATSRTQAAAIAYREGSAG